MTPASYATVKVMNLAIEEVLAWCPWLQRPGIRVGSGNRPAHFYDQAARVPYIIIPQLWYVDEPVARRVVAHEMGHEWERAVLARVGEQVNGERVAQALGVDAAVYGLPGYQNGAAREVVAEIFGRTLTGMVEYHDLEPYSRPSVARTAFIESSGALPDTLEEEVAARWWLDQHPDEQSSHLREWIEARFGRLFRVL